MTNDYEIARSLATGMWGPDAVIQRRMKNGLCEFWAGPKKGGLVCVARNLRGLVAELKETAKTHLTGGSMTAATSTEKVVTMEAASRLLAPKGLGYSKSYLGSACANGRIKGAVAKSGRGGNTWMAPLENVETFARTLKRRPFKKRGRHVTTKQKTSPMRALRMAMPTPPTLEDVARFVQMRGLTCTAGHLSAVERGAKRAGPRLLAVLADIYQADRDDVVQAMDDTAVQPETNGRRRAKGGKR